MPPSSTRAAVALAVAIAPAAARAAVPDALPVPLTWVVLAALGLFAVVVGAVITARRGRRDAERGVAEERPADDLRAFAPSQPFIRDIVVTERAAEPAAPAVPAAVRTRRPAPHAQASPIPIASAAAPACPPPADEIDAPAPTDAVLREAVVPSPAPSPEPSHATPAGPATTPPAPSDEAQASEEASQLFLALHHVDLSIDVLRRHLAAESRPMPAVWVMLLDLCRTHGREAAFREIAAEFHSRFNVAPPAWDHYPPGRDEPGLEAYPRIVKDLTLCWGTHECRRLLDRLLFDNRNGGRRGFTMNAYNDLIALRRAADVVLDTIEQDFAEESKVRDAYARAATDDAADAGAGVSPGHPSPLVRDLESQLDTDLREHSEAKSALEREHPAFAEALTREWRGAALAGRLAEMLARTGEITPPLSPEAREDVALLHDMAERLAGRKQPTLAAD